MSFKTLLTALAVVTVPTGVTCMLFPGDLLAYYGITLTEMGNVIYQFWGSTLAGIGLLAWFIRDLDNAPLQRRIATALGSTTALGTLMAVRGQGAGANVSGWSTVVLFGLFTLAFAAFVITGRSSRRSE
jgi:hypothetical protein